MPGKDLLDQAITPLRYPAMLKPLNMPQPQHHLDVFAKPDYRPPLEDDTQMTEKSPTQASLHSIHSLCASSVPETRRDLNLADYSLAPRALSPVATQPEDLSLTLPELTLPPIREPAPPVVSKEPTQPTAPVEVANKPSEAQPAANSPTTESDADDIRAKICSSAGLYALDVDQLEEAIADIIREPGFIPFVRSLIQRALCLMLTRSFWQVHSLERNWRARLMIQSEK